MSYYFAGVLTVFLVINCLLLILLVLVQLPKKDAGAGLAFGAGAADALFGAGSGNALTKITKYATIAFLVLAVLLGYLDDSLYNKSSGSAFEKQVQQSQLHPAAAPAPAPTTAPAAVPQAATNAPAIMPAMPAVTTGTNAAK
jgi:protein translocase SecG subunit